MRKKVFSIICVVCCLAILIYLSLFNHGSHNEPSNIPTEVTASVSSNSVSNNSVTETMIYTPSINNNVKVTVDADCGYTVMNKELLSNLPDGVEPLALYTKVSGNFEDMQVSDDYKEESVTINYVSKEQYEYLCSNVLYTAFLSMFESYSTVDLDENTKSALSDVFIVDGPNTPSFSIKCGDYDFKVIHNIFNYDTTYVNELQTMDSNVLTAFCELNNGDYIMFTYSYADAALYNCDIPRPEDIILNNSDKVELDDELLATYQASIDLYNSNYENLEISISDFISHISISE